MGGPLVQDHKLVGLVSFEALDCLNPTVPNVCTRVYNYMSWIKGNINFNSQN